MYNKREDLKIKDKNNKNKNNNQIKLIQLFKVDKRISTSEDQIQKKVNINFFQRLLYSNSNCKDNIMNQQKQKNRN